MDYHFVVLAVLFVLSSVFWATVSFKLIDRLMSRNYYDYKVADVISDKKKEEGIQTPDINDLEEYRQAMNAMNEVIR